MAKVTISVNISCLECGSDNIKINDYSEMSWFCECLDCGHRFERMRE